MLSRLAARTCVLVLAFLPPGLPRAAGHAGLQEAAPELVPLTARKPLRSAIGEIARLGDPDDVATLREIIVELGHDPVDLAKFDRKWQRTLERAKTPAPDRLRATTARKLGRAIRGLEDLLAGADPTARTALAALILRLDAESEAAHVAVGHVRNDGAWRTAQGAAYASGAAYLRELEQSALSLPIRIADAIPSTLAPAKLLYGDSARHVTAHGVHIHGPSAGAELKRILRATLRAIALSRASRGESLEVPTFDPPLVFVFTATEDEYQRTLEEATANGGADARVIAGQKAVRVLSFVDRRGWRTSRWRPESQCKSLITWEAVRQLLGHGAQPALVAGHINWLCLRSFGTATPSSVWQDKFAGDGLSTATPGQRNEALWRSASSGVFGCRSWIRARLESGQRVTFARSLVDELGKVSGEPLLVATLVSEYLQATGEYTGMLESTREKATAGKGRGEEATRLAAFESAIGMTVPEFDSEWTGWVGGDSVAPAGLLQRIQVGSTARRGAGPGDVEERALRHLLAVRSRAFAPLKVWFEAVALFSELSAGAGAHARYLEAHPEQKPAWPDAHEEYSDRADFTAEGAWAGAHSVIAFNGDPVAAIDAWMGTFFHRLPLLDPGLCGIGVGLHEDVVVLDAGSLRNQYWGEALVLWPPRGAKDVPRRFVPEIPNPVPGEDQSTWGYPVTVQAFWGQQTEPHTLHISMARAEDSAEVPCHLITPSAPFFDALAPVGAYCLIPRSPLAKRTTYTVTARTVETGDVTEWSFTTGS